MRIIDPHVHVWINDPAFPWPAENPNPPAEDHTAEELLALMDANGVEKTVLVQVIHYRWDNSYVAHVIKQYPDRFMAVGRINPEDPASPDHMSMWTEEHGLHGMRLSPSRDASGDWFKGPGMDPIFARAQDLGIPMLILTGASRMPDLARILDRYPDVDCCIDHMARRPSRQPRGAAMADGYGPLPPRVRQNQPHVGRSPSRTILGLICTRWSRKCIRPLGRSALCGARIGRCVCRKG